MRVNGRANVAVEAGVRTYTISADPEHSSWFASVGWKCKRLGPAQYQGGQVFTALGIEIDPAIRANFMAGGIAGGSRLFRSEEHTSELQSLMRISYAVFCLKKKKTTKTTIEYQSKDDVRTKTSLSHNLYPNYHTNEVQEAELN